MKILILNGPNLNLLGKREKELYGNAGYTALCSDLEKYAKKYGADTEQFQSNHEGEIIDKIHLTDADAIIINAGGLTHTSVSIRDALAACKISVVEVHITNIYAREKFRQKSLLSGVCTAVVCGMGTDGYKYAIEYLVKNG
jgi:3-dehydroquinate dehydratase-2